MTYVTVRPFLAYSKRVAVYVLVRGGASCPSQRKGRRVERRIAIGRRRGVRRRRGGRRRARQNRARGLVQGYDPAHVAAARVIIPRGGEKSPWGDAGVVLLGLHQTVVEARIRGRAADVVRVIDLPTALAGVRRGHEWVCRPTLNYALPTPFQ